MDQQDFVIDLESGTGVICSTEERSPYAGSSAKLPKPIPIELSNESTSVDDGFVKLSVSPVSSNEGCPEHNVKVVINTRVEGEKVGDSAGKKMGKDKRKKASSAKKPPKPPRPPRGFSLDAADQKFIKELTELAMMKRARIERMKVLNQKKALRASSSSSSSSSNGSLFAMLFTVIFFLVILLQGMSCRSSGATPQTAAESNENGLIFKQEQLNPSASYKFS